MKKSGSKCPYYKAEAIEELSNEILASIISRPNEVDHVSVPVLVFENIHSIRF